MFVGCFVARKYSETLGGAAHNLYMILMMFLSDIHLLLLLHLSSFSLIDCVHVEISIPLTTVPFLCM